MTSAAEQQALIEGPSGNPGLPSDDFSDEAFAPSKKQSLKLGFLKLGGLQHILKLRTRQQLRNNLFAELGADLNASRMAVTPKAALEYRVKSNADKHLMTLRADRRALYIQKSFPLNAFNKITGRLQTTAATSYDGVPELHFGFEQIRPHWMLAVGALALLAGNKTVSGGRTFGKTNVHIPVVHQDSLAQGEASVSLRRNGKGLVLSFNQLNAFLRL